MPTKTIKSHMRKSKSGKPCKVRSYLKSSGKKIKRKKNSFVFSQKAAKLHAIAAGYSQGKDINKHTAKRALHLSEHYDNMARKSRKSGN